MYALLAIVCLTFAVEIGVHVLHKDALAQTIHWVKCKAGGDPAVGVDLEIQIQTGPVAADPDDWTSYLGETNALGVFTVTDDPNAAAICWRIIIHDEVFDPSGGDDFFINYPIVDVLLEE